MITLKFYEDNKRTSAVGIIPEMPGIYALSHNGKVVYVGQTTSLLRRYRSWAAAVHHERHRLVNAQMKEPVRTWPKHGWAFSVVKSGINLTADDLNDLERQAIRNGLDAGFPLLNADIPDAPKIEPRENFRQKRQRLDRERAEQGLPPLTFSEFTELAQQQSITKVTDSEP